MALSKIVADSIQSNAVVSALTDNTVTSAKLTTTGVVANSYGNSTSIPVVTVDVAGRVTGVTLANTVPNYDTAYANAVAYADAKVANLVNASPAALDTLSELANALGNDASFSTTVLTGIASAYSNAVADAANLYLPLAGGAVSGNVTLTGSRFNISSNTNISNGRTVTAITRTAQGSGYTSAPSVVISAPTTTGGVQATAQARMFIWSMPTTTAGTGYTIGNTLTAVGGTGNAYSFTVTSVDGSGGITGGSTIVNYGDYTVTPTNPVTFTGGSGTGFTSNMTWTVGSTFNITNAGSGYVEQPTVTFSGGGGSGAAAYATVGGDTTVRSIGQSIFFNHPNGTGLQIKDAGFSQAYFLLQSSGTTIQAYASGTASQIGYQWVSKVGGSHSFATNSTVSNEQFRISHTANAVNYAQVTGAATTSAPTISAQGSDTNIPIELNAKGTSNVTFRSGTSAIFQAIMNTGGDSWLALNRLTGSVSLVGTSVTASNVDITVTPKGSGIVRASGGMFVNGAITVANSTGNTVTISADGVLTVAANVNFDNGTLFVNGANNRVGINNTAPTHALTVTGDVSLGNTLVIAANGNVGIGNSTPTSKLLIRSGNIRGEEGIISPAFYINRAYGTMAGNGTYSYDDITEGGVVNLKDHPQSNLGAFTHGTFSPWTQPDESMTWNYFRILFRATRSSNSYDSTTVNFITAGYFYSIGWYEMGSSITFNGMDGDRGARWVALPWIDSSFNGRGFDVPGIGIKLKTGNGTTVRIGAAYVQYRY